MDSVAPGFSMTASIAVSAIVPILTLAGGSWQARCKYKVLLVEDVRGAKVDVDDSSVLLLREEVLGLLWTPDEVNWRLGCRRGDL